MRGALDAQWLCDNKLTHGIAVFTYNLYKALIRRSKNKYTLFFFDCGKEHGNREKLKRYFSEDEVEFFECKSDAEVAGIHGDVYFTDSHTKIPPKMKGKWVVIVHDSTPLLYKNTKPHIITASEHIRQNVLKAIPEYNETEVTAIGLGYNARTHYHEVNKAILNELQINGDYLLFFSPFEKRKNSAMTFEAFNMIANKFPNVKLVMTGDFSNEAAETMAHICRSKFRERIIVTSVVSDDEKRTLMSGALATLYPSLCEGFGLPIIEAQACGCPVITSNTTSMPEVAGKAALLIDPHSVEFLANAMEKVIISKYLRENLIKKGYENIKRYTWDLAAEKMESVFSSAYASA